MIKAFKERRPWAAAVINAIFHPFLGMLYLGRGRLALGYLAIEFVWGLLVIGLLVPRMWDISPQLVLFALWTVPLSVIGAVQGYAVAKQRRPYALQPNYSRWYALLGIWLLFPISALLIRTFLIQPFDARSASMEPTFNIGDYFLASKRPFVPQRGDLIVFHAANGDYVKRIAGIAGDKVQMKDGRLILNNTPVPRHRIEDFAEVDDFGGTKKIRQYVETLPTGRSYRTLNLDESSPEDNTEVFVVPAGHYFVLGDNRDNSDDSRTGVGYVARSDIIGNVFVKFADRQHTTMIWESVN